MVKKILFSLDVITDSTHRESHRTNGDWNAYHESFSDDTPNDSIIELINVLSDHYAVFVYSDMPESSRQPIMDWLIEYGCNVEDVLLSSSRGSLVAKKLDAVRDVIEDCEFVWESNLMVVEQLREEGITVFECLS
jgi:hypothetical protein